MEILGGLVGLAGGFFKSRRQRKAARARQRAILKQAKYNQRVRLNDARKVRMAMGDATKIAQKGADLATAEEKIAILKSGATISGSSLKNLTNSIKNRRTNITRNRMSYLNKEQALKDSAEAIMYKGEMEGEAAWQKGRMAARDTLISAAVGAGQNFMSAYGDIKSAKQANTFSGNILDY